MNAPVTVVDPRIPRPERPITLARRRATGTVLLLDNGKLRAHSQLRELYPSLATALRSRLPGCSTRVRVEDLLTFDLRRIEALAAELAADPGLTGVVLALCDWGVSQPTGLLALGLEVRGVPTVLLGTDVGMRQIVSNAGRLAPGLPVVSLGDDIGVTGPVESVVAAAVEHVVAGLRHTPAPDADSDVPVPDWAVDGGTLELGGRADASHEFTQIMRTSHLGDGLPLVAPRTELVARFLDAAGLEPGEPIWPALAPRSTPVTAREAAAVAVLAGCEPRWARPVMEAFRAMAAAEFRVFQAATTTYPGGTMVLVGGPAASELGYAAGSGSLGPGFPANATTGRAIALSGSFLLGAIPGSSDFSHQGSPAEYSYVCVENAAASPWPTLNQALGYAATDLTVTVLKCEGPRNVVDQLSTTPEGLLDTVADAMRTWGSNSSYVPAAQLVVMLNPGHAALLHSAGWTRAHVQDYLFARARNDESHLRHRGLPPIRPDGFGGLDRLPVTSTPEDILVVVVGTAGPASQLAMPWGFSRAVTRAVPVSRLPA